MPTALSPDQLAQYRRDGFVVLPGFRRPPELAALRERAEQIVAAFEPGDQVSIFSTHEQRRTADAYFLGSGDQIRCFFEEEAFDAAGRLRQAKARSINKIGHALHDLDPVFEAFSHGPELAGVASAVGLAQPRIWQSMYIFKQPGIGGEVGWHQDATFFETTPQSVTTFWFALEDATLKNGCLWVAPGAHRGPLRQRFVRQDDQVRMDTLDTTPWPSGAEAQPLEVPAGTLVVFHGLLPHYSAPNRSPHSRHAYTLHVTDGRAAYAAHNWLQRDASLPLRGFV
ncbi:MAG: phytanoyl-CoA dioxygenase family protein [Rhodoferax sp.]|nr:phytanoyl-CoA dioxygenase family protein [Rhodoferax sp.]